MKMSCFGFSIEPSAAGDFPSFVNYDARFGRIFRVDKKSTGTGWEKIETDITANFKAIFDLEKLMTGWMNFTAAGPDRHLVPVGEILPAKPSASTRTASGLG